MTTFKATISEVQTVVAEMHAIPREALKSGCRKRIWAWPRQEAMKLARELTGHSYPSIARHFGDRDHTTCLYADRKIRAREETDHHLAARLHECRARIAALVSLRIGRLVSVPSVVEEVAGECPVLATGSPVVELEPLLVPSGPPAPGRMGGLATQYTRAA